MRLSDTDGASVGIWGAGREGIAALRALRSHSAPRSVVVVTDQAPAPAQRDALGQLGVTVAWGEEGARRLAACEIVIKSPGISRHRPDVLALAAAGVVITSGTQLWLSEHADEHVVAITATKGKSTTASLLAHALRRAGRTVTLAGNIGVPLLDELRPGVLPQFWVVELSSFQTAELTVSPRIVVLLNVIRDHLDWHGSLERYRADKLNLIAHGPQVVIANAADNVLRRAVPQIAPDAEIAWFGADPGLHLRGRDIVAGDREVLAERDNPLRGAHNALNVCAVLVTLERLGVQIEPAEAVRDFRGLPHRLQIVARSAGTIFVDDSISTTPEAAIAALEAFDDRPVALIVGGQDRAQDYRPLADAIAGSAHVVAVIAIPDNGPRIAEELRAVVPASVTVAEAADIAAAVALAAGSLSAGAVLLSPAAPSFGRFTDFTDRGDQFAALARSLR
jgi:UDP-N-acetylmuramoylalanine--D-glutamate ligase